MSQQAKTHLAIINQRLFSEALPFSTDRLTIREIEPRDTDGFHSMVTHPGFSYYCFDGSRESTQVFVDQALESQQAIEKGSLRKNFMMSVEDTQTGELVGHVTVDLLDKAPEDYDLAYFTHPKQQGKGIASEVSQGFLQKVFELLKPQKVVATVHPDNHPSIKVLDRLGFEATGGTSSVESADGKNERLWFVVTPERFQGPQP